MPILDDLPIDEKVRHANLALKTRPRDVEETLLQLINDPDQIVAAAAIDLVEELKVWTLADDVEFVLAHRDVKDWYVFEAASWALAAYRLPGNKRRTSGSSRCRSFRLLHVCATFRCSSPCPLPSSSESPRPGGRSGTRMDASSIRLAAFQTPAVPARRHRHREGGRPGRTRDRRAGGARLRGDPRWQSHARDLTHVRVGSVSDGRSRRVPGAPIRQYRVRAGPVPDVGGRRASGRWPVMTGRHSAGLTHHDGPLTPIGKVLMLEDVPVFADVGPDEMLHLASIASEVPMTEGSTLFSESDASAVWVILAGRAVLESVAGGDSVATEAGDVVGIYDTLAGTPIGRRAASSAPAVRCASNARTCSICSVSARHCCGRCCARCLRAHWDYQPARLASGRGLGCSSGESDDFAMPGVDVGSQFSE